MIISNTSSISLNRYIPKSQKEINKKVNKTNIIKVQETDENASSLNTNKKAKKKQPQYTPEQIREEVLRITTQNKTQTIYSKARNGSKLSPEEAKHLAENSPELYDMVKEAEKEREMFRKELESLNSKNDIEKFKTAKSLDFLHKIKKAESVGNNSDVEKYTMFLNTIENEYRAYTKTDDYKKLPTKGKDDL